MKQSPLDLTGLDLTGLLHQAAACREVRKELMPLVERLAKGLWGGKKPEDYKGDRFLKKQVREPCPFTFPSPTPSPPLHRHLHCLFTAQAAGKKAAAKAAGPSPPPPPGDDGSHGRLRSLRNPLSPGDDGPHGRLRRRAHHAARPRAGPARVRRRPCGRTVLPPCVARASNLGRQLLLPPANLASHICGSGRVQTQSE